MNKHPYYQSKKTEQQLESREKQVQEAIQYLNRPKPTGRILPALPQVRG